MSPSCSELDLGQGGWLNRPIFHSLCTTPCPLSLATYTPARGMHKQTNALQAGYGTPKSGIGPFHTGEYLDERREIPRSPLGFFCLRWRCWGVAFGAFLVVDTYCPSARANMLKASTSPNHAESGANWYPQLLRRIVRFSSRDKRVSTVKATCTPSRIGLKVQQ